MQSWCLTGLLTVLPTADVLEQATATAPIPAVLVPRDPFLPRPHEFADLARGAAVSEPTATAIDFHVNPEPSSLLVWAMLLSGVLAVAYALRHRRGTGAAA